VLTFGSTNGESTYKQALTMGQSGGGFHLSRPHTILPNTYMFPYSYLTGMRSRIPSPSPTGSGIPAPSPSPQWIIYFNKKKVFFSPGLNVVMHYPTNR